MKQLSFLLFFALLLAGCGSSLSSSSSDTKDVKKSIETFANWYADKDPKVLKGLFTEEPEAIVYSIGSDVMKGGDNIISKLKKGMDDVEDSNIDTRDQVIKVVGNTAWVLGAWRLELRLQRPAGKAGRHSHDRRFNKGRWQVENCPMAFVVPRAATVMTASTHYIFFFLASKHKLAVYSWQLAPLLLSADPIVVTHCKLPIAHCLLPLGRSFRFSILLKLY